MFNLVLIILTLIFVALYFVPSFVAIGRKHAHVLQITILNAFLGWTFVAWVASLIWATTNFTNKETSTKGSWIIISVFAIFSILPFLLLGLIPSSYKSSIMEESQYKNVTFTNSNGKQIKQETKIKQVQAN